MSIILNTLEEVEMTEISEASKVTQGFGDKGSENQYSLKYSY